MSRYERFLLYPLLIVALIYGVMGNPVMKANPGTEVFERIEAREILIKNGEGEVVISLSLNEENAGEVTVYNREGVRNAALRATEGGGGIATFNKENVMGAIVGTTEDGGSIITYNSKGEMGAAVGTTDNGGVIGTFNRLGELIIFLDQTDDGDGIIYVFDKHGEIPAVYGHEQ